MQKLSPNYKVLVDKYFDEIDQIKSKFGEDKIDLNFDETPVYYDLSGEYTYNKKGEKQIIFLKILKFS